MAAQSTLRQASSDRFTRLFDRLYESLIARFDRLPRSSPLSRRTAKLIATTALALTIVLGGYGGFKLQRAQKRKQEEGRRLLRRNSGLRGKDGSRVIIVPYKDGTKRVEIHPTKTTTFSAHQRYFLHPPYRGDNDAEATMGVPPVDIKPGLNLAFVHQFMSLMNIMVPRWRSKESGLLLAQACVLLSRTYMSLVIARVDGELAKDLVARNGRGFLKGIAKWLSWGVAASFINSWIKHLQAKTSIAFRTRLTRYIHDLYLHPSLAYYKLHHLDGGIGQHADHYVTQDLTLFCESAASLYSSIGKPTVDMIFFNYQLYRELGSWGLTGMVSCYVATVLLIKKLQPPFGKIKAMEAQREGEYRALHSRLIANAEEVAFYAGGPTEHTMLNKSFKALKHSIEETFQARIEHNCLEDFVLKYGWSALGYIFASLPVFFPVVRSFSTPQPSHTQPPTTTTTSSPATSELARNAQASARIKQFLTHKHIMLSLADAGSRLMYSMKDLAELAGLTSRVFALISTLHRVNADAYHRPSTHYPDLFSLSDVDGTLAKGYDGVRLDNVPIVAPALYPMGGEELIAGLDFRVGAGQHVLITGPNGAGKSSVARIMAGLWPTFRGIASRPRHVGQDGIMFIPQRPYLSNGTLRDQVIYPHTAMDMADAQRRDGELQAILEESRLGYLAEREGGWDTQKMWKDVLSGGEKQRMGIARLLYHEPRYAFIDEGTSAVSSDVEGLLYETCKARGITLITISTRASLKRYHDYTLTLGLGEDASGYEFARIGTQSEKESVEKEIQELRGRLEHVEEWRRRRRDIDEELSKVWTFGEDDDGGEAQRKELDAPIYEAGRSVED